MRYTPSRLSRRKLFFLSALIILGIAVYLRSRPPEAISSPLTIQPATPADRDEARKKYLLILQGALEKSFKSHGSYPFLIPKTEIAICNGSSLHCKQSKLLDINSLISDGILASIPSDPSGGRGQYNSGFTIRRDPDGAIFLLAPRTEGPVEIIIKL